MASKTRSRRSQSMATARPPESTPVTTKKAKPGRSLRYAKVEEQLIAAIKKQLPYYRLPSDVTDRAVLFANYLEGLKKLDPCRQELMTLGTQIGMATIFYETPPDDKIRADTEAQILAQYAIALDAPVNMAGAEIGSLSVDECRLRLDAALDEACRKLITQFFDGLLRLNERQLIGMAHWPGPNAIKYHFYRHRIRPLTPQSTTTTTQMSRASRWSPLGERIETEYLQRIESGTPVEIHFECHQHDAIDAFTTSIENSQVVMPANVQALIRAIPPWMRPSIRIVDGYLIRERVNQRKTTELLVVTDVKEEVYTEYTYGFEPAVLLDEIVLTGWGPKEIENAATANQQQEAQATAWTECIFWLVCALSIQAPVACFINGPGLVPRSLVLAALLFIGSVFCMALSLRNFFAWRMTPVKEAQFQMTMTGPSILLLGFLMTLVGAGNAMSVFGVAFFILGVGVTNKLIHKQLRDSQV